MDPTLSPGLGRPFATTDNRFVLAGLLGGIDARFATPGPPVNALFGPIDGRGGGAIDVLGPPNAGRGRVMDIEGGRVFEGVPVRGVEVVDVAADNCFVGDLVGDLSSVSK